MKKLLFESRYGFWIEKHFRSVNLVFICLNYILSNWPNTLIFIQFIYFSVTIAIVFQCCNNAAVVVDSEILSSPWSFTNFLLLLFLVLMERRKRINRCLLWYLIYCLISELMLSANAGHKYLNGICDTRLYYMTGGERRHMQITSWQCVGGADKHLTDLQLWRLRGWEEWGSGWGANREKRDDNDERETERRVGRWVWERRDGDDWEKRQGLSSTIHTHKAHLKPVSCNVSLWSPWLQTSHYSRKLKP